MMVAARAAMVYKKPDAGPELYKDFYEHMRREILTSENKMVFSRTLDFLFGKDEFSVYDVDAIVFDWQLKRHVAAFELKFKSWRVAEKAWLDGYVEVNGYQFIRTKKLARLLRIPLYYFIQLGHYPKAKYVTFDPRRIHAELERKYEGTYAEDLYALIPLDNAIVSKSIEDLRTDLGLLIGR